ncbi:hypothetical protein N0V82_001122 [Gnomoniopsis sp. IMI 355080]|nr:hypothetical protein N0V82_001122 [Gnomoniopsis sp. IMI 355080]
MPEHRFSDNMYSAVDDSDVEDNPDELYTVAAGLGLGDSSYRPGGPSQQHHQQPNEEEILSPSDGYFGRSEPQPGESATTAYPSDLYAAHNSQGPHHDQVPFNTSTSARVPRSSQVPHVPNVWVSDPSLEQGSIDKAREAQEERDQYQNSRQRYGAATDQHRPDPITGTSSLSSPAAGTSNDAASSLLNPPLPATARRSTAASPPSTPSGAAHRYTPSNNTSSSVAPGPYHPRRIYSERSSLFGDAPPAYTPSPTSPTSNTSSGSFNNYQTFSPTSPTAPGTSIMGRLSESESHGLLAGQTYTTIPQSMGGELDPNDDGHFEYPRPSGWRDRLRHFSWRKHSKWLLLGIVLLFITLGFLVSSIRGLKNEKTIKFPGGAEDRPVTNPGEKIPVVGDDGTRLGYPPYDKETFGDYDTRMCGSKQLQYNRVRFELDFSPSRNVSVFQDIREGDPPYHAKDIRVQGEIVVRRSGEGTPSPSIVLETASNHDAIEYTVDWDDAEQRLFMLTPRSITWSQSDTSPCLSLRATIWAPPNSALASLNIDSVHLGIHLLDNLSLKLNDYVRLATTVGKIVSATDGEKDAKGLMYQPPPASFALDSRYIEVKTMSAPISGSWPLYDYLGLETISGTILAGVTPKEALKESPRPAILYAHSTSGTIEVFENIAGAAATWASQQNAGGMSTMAAEKIIPARQYGVDLYSMSGSVKANVAFGSSCKVHTTSGQVDLTLLPVLDLAQADATGSGHTSSLETSTTSGTTNINVLEPLWGDLASGSYVNLPNAPDAPNTPTLPAAPTVPREENERRNIGDSDPYDLVSRIDPAIRPNRAVRALNGRHTATSATIRVTYPASWEGWIDGDSMTGKIGVRGEGVQIIRQDQDFPGIKRHVLARKGEGDGGNLKVHTTSGSIGVVIGS